MSEISFPLWDRELFLYLNSLHSPFFDPIMKAFSSSSFWIPLYIILAIVIVYKYKLKGVLAILFIFLAFGLADMLSVHLFKNTFLRLRPCHDAEISLIMRSIENCGGYYGFISNHAANTFSLAMFTSLLFKNKYFTFSIFIWAALVSYSRIYVGKHFPLDIMVGACFGILCAIFSFYLYRVAYKHLSLYLERKKQI